MRIVVKDTIDEVDSKKEVHHLTARKELEDEVKRRESILRGDYVDAAGGGRYRPLDRLQDPGAMRKELKDFKRNLERGIPIKLSSKVENELWKKARVLKDEFVIGMVSQTDMHPVKPRTDIAADGTKVVKYVADYDKLRETKAIERNQVWINRNQPKINEFKRIMRLLEPDNPNIANVERFRK